MKAYSYRRVSSKGQARDGTSLESQADIIDRYCLMRGWELAEDFEDSESGRTLKHRYGLKRAVKAVIANQGVLVVYSLSRLGRSTIDNCNILKELDAKRVPIAICDCGIDTQTAQGRCVFSILSSLAQLESEMIGERIKIANDYTMRTRGYRTQGQQPFGWMLDDEKNRLPRPEEQEVIAEAKRLMRGGLRSYRTAAKALNEQGYRSRKGKPWSGESLRVAMLSDERTKKSKQGLEAWRAFKASTKA